MMQARRGGGRSGSGSDDGWCKSNGDDDDDDYYNDDDSRIPALAVASAGSAAGQARSSKRGVLGISVESPSTSSIVIRSVGNGNRRRRQQEEEVEVVTTEDDFPSTSLVGRRTTTTKKRSNGSCCVIVEQSEQEQQSEAMTDEEENEGRRRRMMTTTRSVVVGGRRKFPLLSQSQTGTTTTTMHHSKNEKRRKEKKKRMWSSSSPTYTTRCCRHRYRSSSSSVYNRAAAAGAASRVMTVVVVCTFLLLSLTGGRNVAAATTKAKEATGTGSHYRFLRHVGRSDGEPHTNEVMEEEANMGVGRHRSSTHPKNHQHQRQQNTINDGGNSNNVLTMNAARLTPGDEYLLLNRGSTSTYDTPLEPPPSDQRSSIKQYSILPTDEIHSRLQTLATSYPNLCILTTSQDEYGLQPAGTSSDCPRDTKYNGCPNYILIIEDIISHPPNSDSSNVLPTVLLSGALHGNERVGPTAVLETAELLLAAASCQSKPIENDGGCRDNLASTKGLSKHDITWLSRLVTTRRIIIIPTTNALGYYQDRREEGNLDPNRDFPYDVIEQQQGGGSGAAAQSYPRCMQTIAARTLNELYREYIIQITLTYHAGMVSLGYEWGNFAYFQTPVGSKQPRSPDDDSQRQIGAAYSSFAGKEVSGGVYPHGSMNEQVYPVRGGMEDFTYAGSWDTTLTSTCAPTTYGGYPPSKTQYESGMTRSFTTLVETSDMKTPLSSTLGNDSDILNPESNAGHVSRNIRLALLSIDIVEPYVSILSVGSTVLPEQDSTVKPLQSENGACVDSSSHTTIVIPWDTDNIEVTWTVGGAFTIDQTSVIAVKWDDIPNEFNFCGGTSSGSGSGQVTQDQLDAFATSQRTNIYDTQTSSSSSSSAQQGYGRFHQEGPKPMYPNGDTTGLPPNVPIFSTEIPISPSRYQNGDRVALLALAQVDESWSHVPTDAVPNTKPGPQTHLANARTNPLWKHVLSSGKKITGRQVWLSIPVTLSITDPSTLAGRMNGGDEEGVTSAGGAFSSSSTVDHHHHWTGPSKCVDTTQEFRGEYKSWTCHEIENTDVDMKARLCQRYGQQYCPATCDLCTGGYNW